MFFQLISYTLSYRLFLMILLFIFILSLLLILPHFDVVDNVCCVIDSGRQLGGR
jgi:hypothetical protein